MTDRRQAEPDPWDLAEGVTGAAPWKDPELWDRAATWEKKAPGTSGELIGLIKSERRHAHRLAWAYWALRFFGLVSGLGFALTVVALEWRYADLGSSINGGVLLGAGAASIVAILVTGKHRDRKR